MRNDCWMVVPDPNRPGGGNAEFGKYGGRPRIIIRRNLAIGDVLCSTIVADRLFENGFSVGYQCHNIAFPILARVASVSGYNQTKLGADIDLDGCYENDPKRREKHFHQMFLDTANRQLKPRDLDLGGVYNCTPRLLVSRKECSTWNNLFEKYPQPWVTVCPRSSTYAVRTVGDPVWSKTANDIPGTKFWIGTHPAPAGFVDLHVRNLDSVIQVLTVTDLLLTCDTGPMHIAAALRTPMIVLNQSSFAEWHLSDQNDYTTLIPEGNLTCLDCQKNLCPIDAYFPPCQNFDPKKIAAAACNRLTEGKISAAISVYQPEADTLNRCLNALLPQVDEIVICRDLYGKFPEPLRNHPKIRYVIKPASNIGYGRKQNFAVRHTTGEFVLLINDDVFLDEGAVQGMVDCMKDGQVGMVSNLLRFGNGTIYHAGKARKPGNKNWYHLDLGGYLPTHKEPAEMENVCGACILVRRAAFYDSGCFDERFFLFAEDDDMSLSFRKHGWKLMFTPHSTGVHLEHQSVNKTPKWVEIMHQSNHTFGMKWHGYRDWNVNRVPGNFDYLKV